MDLAGAENIAKSGVEGKGKHEAVAINLSLSNLEHCLNQVRNGTVKGVAFRENALTQLLREPICGFCLHDSNQWLGVLTSTSSVPRPHNQSP